MIVPREALTAPSTPEPRVTASVITEADLDGLPNPVRRYMVYTGVLGTPRIKTVHLKYQGKFRLGTGKFWLPIEVTQVYTTHPPGFLWKARFKLAGLPFMFAEDQYQAGHGHMRGKLAGLFTVVDESGDEVDQGAMIRYLQEMIWFPTAYLGDNITWSAVSDHAADVHFRDHHKQVGGRMYFDAEGRLLTFSAQRYGQFDGQYSVSTWSTPMTEFGVFNGLRLPVAGVGLWQLPGGDLPYINVHITDIQYNQPVERL